MAKNTIRFNDKAFHTIIMSSGTRQAVSNAAGRIYNAAGGGMRVRSMVGNYGGGRPIAFVATTAKTPEEAATQRERLEAAALGGGA